MKKQFSTLLGLTLCVSSSVFAQNHERQLDKQNMRQGEHVEYCVTHKKMNQLLANPEFAKQHAKEQQEFDHALLSKKGEGSTKALEYTIPVVFHVLHNGGPENISKDQIMSALTILNRDYAMLNADTIGVQAAFQGIRSKVDVKFVLATKAPNGACFSGITRTQNIATSNGDDGQAQVNAIVAGNDVYNGQWPGNKYLNIFICQDIGGAAGYTFNPGGWSANSMGNGIWVLSTYVGDIGTSSTYTSRTLTHEVGHWLNLSHVWGGTNDPGVSCGSDGVSDTPACIGSTACFLNQSTCSSDNAYWGFDQIDNVENYMDYSYCSKMFTAGQVDRMRTALTVSSTGRANVVSASNLTAVGASTAPILCSAKFSTTRRVICQGETIQFTDESFNAVSGWNWSFAGGLPATSTTQNPSITYNTPGTYAVQLDATDGSNSNTANIVNYITVLPAPTGIPYYESFEAISNFTNSDWFVENGGGNSWNVTTTVGRTGTHSAKLENYGQSASQIDELESRSIDLSGITSATNATLSFRYAYRKRTSTNTDLLKVFLSKDCGEVWDIRKTLTAATMSGTNLATSQWTPTSADWVTVHMTNVTTAYWVSNFRFKFQFTAGGGNNVYIDDINIYAGAPSDDIVSLGLTDLESFQNINLFPNPAENELQISFTSQTGDQLSFAITDLSGKLIKTLPVHAHEGANLVFIETTDLSAGTYLIKMIGSVQERTFTFVKK
ncbi:M43 family zinc metalloprotease [Fluviicola sp.]|uniref:M43 family zinc metalloprotease n=1 Tax=Fluviicola sp. TaxID=1917219 RepID=UPI003D274F80